MTTSSFLTLIGVWLVAIVSPGPDAVQIIRTAPRSRTAGLLCGAGVVAGTVVWMAASLAGLSALISARPGVLGLLQLAGGLFLVYMGIGAIRSGWAARRQPAVIVGAEDYIERPLDTAPGGELSPARAFRLGLATNLSNPKALVFFGAVFAQFIRPGMGAGWAVVIAVVLAVVALVWFSMFALLVRAIARWISRYAAQIDIGTGVVFVLLGAVMLVESALAFT